MKSSFIIPLENLRKQKIDTDTVVKTLSAIGQVFTAEELTGRSDFTNEELREGIIGKVVPKCDCITLIGDDEALPFFRLDNPASDSDKFVLSDNPWGCPEDEYLVPEFPVSRIPSCRHCPDFLPDFIKKNLDEIPLGEKRGISAEVWEKASSAVYIVLSPASHLILTPPARKGDLDKGIISSRESILYFNVHGDKNTGCWYGQGAHEFPVIISSSDIENAEKSVIVTESCYGALLDRRGREDSMAMAFLKKGAHVLVGSTTVSYGPAEPPSQEADLVVKYFLQYALKGLPVAQALKNAKVDFSRKMIRQQGYLDEDDKKTLLQFVSYGMAGARMVIK